MSGISQIEAAIQSLPADDFFTLLGWMSDRHLEVLSNGEFESPELEAALLKSLDGPRHPVDDTLFADIRNRARAPKP
jgi:hypothetical protein